ncbi:MAG: hypothetical protein IKX54_05690 [Lachnospiraceae bacterium]|nr:hypothetical protein [Lachnospiraceae bacterium]
MNRRKSSHYATRLSVSFVFFMIFCALGMKYLGAVDFSYVFRWWLVILVIGLAALPFSVVLFNRFNDGGWMFSKTIGIAVGGWLLWYLSSIKLLKFTQTNAILMVVLLCALSIVFYYYAKQRKDRKSRFTDFFTMDRMCAIVAVEVIFFAFFIFWCYLKGISPDANGTERFMDYGFMNSIGKSDYMPAADIWYSGEGINYYYIGQVLAAFLMQISGVPVTHAYNIAMMMLAAFGFSLAYSIGSNMMHLLIEDRAKRNWSPSELAELQSIGCITREEGKPFFRPAVAGTLSGLAVAICGNMHYPYYKYIYPKLQQLHGEEATYKYWFPDATRYIGYMPDVPDKTIHEFPVYSYVIGDLHAHVINMIFVITVLALLLSYLAERRERMEIVRRYDVQLKMQSIVKEVFNPIIVLCAFFVGLFHMTNYWDFPIYFVICGAIILFSNLVIYRFRLQALILTAYQAAMFIVVGALVALPFTLTFDTISTSIGICGSGHHTSQFQLLILWGLPNFCLWSFVIFRIVEFVKGRNKRVVEPLPRQYANQVETEEDAEGKQPLGAVASFITSLEITDLFVITIGLCAFGLVLLPEIIYARDIYTGAYIRANTMFKLTYQAFILFGLSMGYIIVKFISMPRNRLMRALGTVALILLLWTAGYFNEAYAGWYHGFYEGLDATTFIRDDISSAEADIIDHINETFTEQHNVLEMCGASYTYFNRVSAFTAMPTVLGWEVHNWLWRCSGDISKYPQSVRDRHADVITLYTSRDQVEVSKLIEKYDIDYIFVGICERVDGYCEVTDAHIKQGKYKLEDTMTVNGRRCLKIDLNLATLLQLGDIEMQTKDEKTQQDIYLIRVKRDLTATIAGK